MAWARFPGPPTSAPRIYHVNSPTTLTGSHLRTYNAIFQHPVSPHLGWSDVHALFRQLGQVEVEPNGNLKATRNGQVLVLPMPRTKDVAGTDELMALRHFLERSATVLADAKAHAAEWVVVIDHHEARIYRSTAPGAVPQQIRLHTAEDFFRGREKLEPNGFFAPVAGVLNGAGKILIFGSGTGTSSEREQFTNWLKNHRPEIAQRMVGSVVIDEHHMTEAQLLAKARALFASPRTE